MVGVEKTRYEKTRSGKTRGLIFALWMVCSVSGALRAQGTADIVGTVTDNTGAVVPKARVTARNLDTSLVRTTASDAGGDYSFSLLPVGNYSVSVELAGFRTFTNPQLVIATGD